MLASSELGPLEGAAAPLPPRRLTVLYDPHCPICIRCAEWLRWQPTYVDLELAPSTSPDAVARFGRVPWLGAELVVVSDAGQVWVGPAAFVMCLWALYDWREWSYRLSGSALRPMATAFFRMLSKRRHALGRMFAERCDGAHQPGQSCSLG